MGQKANYVGTASACYAHAVLDYFDAIGVPPGAAFGHAQVTQWREMPGRHRLAIGPWQAMLQQAVRHLGDPAFPLKLATTIKPRHLGLLGFLLMSCDTLGAAALTLQRYEHLLDSVNRAEWTLTDTHCRLSWHPLIADPAPELILLSLSLWAIQGRWLTERPDLVCDVRLSLPTDDALQQSCEQLFGGQVLFDQPINELVFPRAFEHLPVAQRDRDVHALLRTQAEAELAALLGQDLGLLAHLQALLAARLESGEVALSEVARALDLAPRTLQHRLDEQGVTYRQLLDKVRCQLAEQHLRDPRLSLAEVAVMLGFADQSGFQHAFKRWKGASPGEYRRRLHAGATLA